MDTERATASSTWDDYSSLTPRGSASDIETQAIGNEWLVVYLDQLLKSQSDSPVGDCSSSDTQ